MPPHTRVRLTDTASRAGAHATRASEDEASTDAHSMAGAGVLHLQHAAGNRATRRLLGALEGPSTGGMRGGPVGNATASAVQLMKNHQNKDISSLAALNDYLSKNNAENF